MRLQIRKEKNTAKAVEIDDNDEDENLAQLGGSEVRGSFLFFFCKFNELFLDTVREKQKGGRRKSKIEDSFFEEPEIDKDNQITFDQMNLSRPILKVFSFF